MSVIPQILVYGRDAQLLATRRLLLERPGYRVRAALSLADFDCIAPGDRVDLVILCHTLSKEECDRAITMIQSRWPMAKALVLTAGSPGCSARIVSEVQDSMAGPVRLLSTVSRMVNADVVHAHA